MPLFDLDTTLGSFPDPKEALTDPDGLLAIGGQLSCATLLQAYQKGIFPWYEQGQPILWWSPSTRAIVAPGDIHISKSMDKLIAKKTFTITSDQAFEQVVDACSLPRKGGPGTWITQAMKKAYAQLHRKGHAHSVECWREEQLVGGLYGVQVGGVFCGESMFSIHSNSSKLAFICLGETLSRHGFSLIDCQLANPHLQSLGITSIPRKIFLEILAQSGQLELDWPRNQAFAASPERLFRDRGNRR